MLKNDLPTRLSYFVETMQTVREIDHAISGHTIRGDYASLILDLEKKFEYIKTHFGLQTTPKMHILCKHVITYIQKRGQSLGATTDQVIERFHQRTERRFTASNYKVKDISSDLQGEKLLLGTLDLNTYNL